MTPAEALATAGALAAMQLEVHDPDLLASITYHVPAHALALAICTVESDPEWAQRWADATAAGNWMEQGTILHEALVWILTPAESPVSPRHH
jgi:hypothetical protein